MSHSTPEIVKQDRLFLVGLSIVTTLKAAFEQFTVKQMEDRFHSRIGEIANRIGTEAYLVQQYPQGQAFDNETPYTVFIGAQVESIADVPEGMSSHVMPQGEYVKVTHQGLEADLHHTYSSVYGEWIPQSGRKIQRFDYEVWDERYQPESADNQIDLYIALEPAQGE